MHDITNHLQYFRNKTPLKQSDMSFFMDSKSTVMLSLYENGKYGPSVLALLVYSIVFDVPVLKLIPHQFKEIEKSILEKCKLLLILINKEENTKDKEERISYIASVCERLESMKEDHQMSLL